MLETKQISAHDGHSNPFVGVRFFLVGFDSVTEDKVQSKLLEGGGVDALSYGPDCNYVIVDKLLYDDPICVAARRDGKILVTGLWVDHSFDVGMPVDPTSVMYKPVRDINGISGANSLVMCLTGYQRQDRDDIMTMVALMGAKFSKPLVANKVTHLICYKFEGEKYELAKKVKAMKLVNHRWLEDCLKAWELLPEADYAKSGYELEMEAEAKDSEDETEDMTSVDLKMKNVINPQNTLVENENFHQSPERQGISRNTSYLSAFETFANVGNTSKTHSTPRKETNYGKASFSRETHDAHPDMSNSSCARSPAKMSSEVPSHMSDGTMISEKNKHVLASASGSAKKSVDGGLSKLSSKSMKASLPLRSERIENNSGSPLSNASKLGLLGGIDMPSERNLDGTGSHGIKTPLKGTLLHPDEGRTAGLPSKKKPTVPRGSLRSPVVNHSPKTLLRSGLTTKPMEMPVSRSPIDGSCRLACDISPTNGSSYLREEVSGGFVMPSEKDRDGIESGGVKTPLKGALFPDEEHTSSLPGKKKETVSRGGSKSTKLSRSPKTVMGIELDKKLTEMPVSGPSVHGSRKLDADVLPTNVTSCLREEISGSFVVPSEKDQDGIESGVVKSPLKGALLFPVEEQTSSLTGKKNETVSRGGSKSTKSSRSPKILMGTDLNAKLTEMPVSGSSVHGSRQLDVDVLPTNVTDCLRDKVSGVFNIPLEREQDGVESGVVKSPSKGALLHLNEEQTSSLHGMKKMTVSRGRSKLTKLSRSPKTIMESGSDTKTMEMPVSGSMIHGSRQSAVDVSPSRNTTSHLREEVSLASKEALTISTLQDDLQECNDQPLKRSRGRPKKRSLPDSDANNLSLSRTKFCTGREEMHQSDKKVTGSPFSSTSSRVDEDQLDGQEDLNSSKVDHSGSQSKPQKKKKLSRKTLGSKLALLKGSTEKHKECISAVLQNEFASLSNGAVAIENTNNVSLAAKFLAVSPTTNEDVPVGDDTEPPENEGPNEYDMGLKNSVEVEEPHSEKETHTTRQPSEKNTQRNKGGKSRDQKSNEAKKSDCSQKTELPESISTGDVAEKKITEGKKRPLAKSKINKLKDPTEETIQNEKKTNSHNEEMVVVAGKTSKRPSKKLKHSDDVEKENEPVTNEQQSVSRVTGPDGKSTHKLKKALQSGCIANKASTESLNTKTEPAWFILSGHRLQRKEFQQVIKRLKGRVCRDSHNWSYQGTHFIVPDPIRRTEKFFAAAASGSWILKTDYLTASNEAGRLLSEEPYEWHKKCLTEDGAINLEAPRKWRLLRERTGHGAFYGMRIVIYGECIAPPLETLKRVVKAGDGTILATSPPYTRFLKSSIDFAIVSPGMPRVEPWVQEFLRHEIPCISADYLVEYVCKPGYSLERHVQYNTHDWAQRSLQKQVNRVEEAVEDPKTPEDNGVDDAACQVCGSRDRGEEMLICGDEGGTCGCGVGTHIGCLDPPLEEVPEEDWFCQECCQKREMKTSSRSSKKRASKSKK